MDERPDTFDQTRGALPPQAAGNLTTRLTGLMLRQLTPGVSPRVIGEAYRQWLRRLVSSPEKLSSLAARGLGDTIQFAFYGMRATIQARTPAYIRPEPHDRRFLDERWQDWPYNLIHQSFLLTERWWRDATTNVPGISRHQQDVVSFATRQILDILSPSNLPLANPEILAATIAQRGDNLRRGAVNLAEDWGRLLAGKRPADLTAPIFAVGALDDFVAPWRSVYRINFLTGAEVTFVLTDGDHHSGIIADPREPNRSFKIATSGAGQTCIDADTWRERATAHSGRWWPEWQTWLSRHSSERGDPPPLGEPSAGYTPLCDAPGNYVLG